MPTILPRAFSRFPRRSHPRSRSLRAAHLRPDHRGARTQIDDALAGFEEPELVVELQQLEGRARAPAFAPGAQDIGIVELALQPALAAKACDRAPSSASP